MRNLFFQTVARHASLLVALLLASLVVVPTLAQTDTLSHNDRRRYQYFFLEALRQQNAGHDAAAFDLLSHCLAINPNAAEAYYLQAMFYSGLDNNDLALKNLERAAALSPGNDMYQERVAQYYLGTNNYQRAIDAYERLYSHHPDRSDVLSVLVYLYGNQKNVREVLRCLNRMEEIDGPSDDITLSKMQAYEQRGDSKMAYKTLKQLADSHPSDVNYQIMLGNWLMQNKRKDDAFKLFTKAVNDEPDNEYALGSLYDYYHDAGNDSLAQQLRDRMLLSTKTSAQTKATMLRQVIKDSEQNGGDSIPVLTLFDKVIKADPKDVDVAMLKAAYMDLKKMPAKQVDTVLLQVLHIAPDNAAARVQLIQSLWKRQRWDDIVKLSKEAVQYNPDEMMFYYFLGMAHYQKNDNDAALDAFRRGVSEINDQSDHDMVSDFYGLMGDILHQKGDNKGAYAAYDKCLEWKADNIACLNNYAYYLSVDNRDLSKAEGMSYKTVKAEPNNATYLDTYAWILYQQKRYAEAKIYIDQAVKNDTDTVHVTPVVIDHAGEIYMKLGDPDRAVSFWQLAISRGGDKALFERKIKKAKK